MLLIIVFALASPASPATISWSGPAISMELKRS